METILLKNTIVRKEMLYIYIIGMQYYLLSAYL